ncbi:hypothetical protein EYC59_00735 [Candidatus Saccharibacteria bacterium]|nr:MAG: hypothetical protein EYC59_00735 [Candidatus Saccharibacteria bacterium]
MTHELHGSLADAIDAQLAASRGVTIGTLHQQEMEIEAGEWNNDNKFLASGLRTHVADLGLAAIIGDTSSQLGRLKGFSANAVTCCNYGWIPERRREAIRAPAPKVRALWMQVVGLVAPNDMYTSRQIEESFYLGTSAIEVPAGGVEFRYFTAHGGKNESPGLAGAYRLFELTGLPAYQVIAKAGMKWPEEWEYEHYKRKLATRLFGYYEPESKVSKAEERRAMRAKACKFLSENPLGGEYDGGTDYVNEVLLQEPNKRNPVTLRSISHDLLSWNRHVDHQQIRDQFDRFVRGSKLVEQLLATNR